MHKFGLLFALLTNNPQHLISLCCSLNYFISITTHKLECCLLYLLMLTPQCMKVWDPCSLVFLKPQLPHMNCLLVLTFPLCMEWRDLCVIFFNIYHFLSMHKFLLLFVLLTYVNKPSLYKMLKSLCPPPFFFFFFFLNILLFLSMHW